MANSVIEFNLLAKIKNFEPQQNVTFSALLRRVLLPLADSVWRFCADVK